MISMLFDQQENDFMISSIDFQQERLCLFSVINSELGIHMIMHQDIGLQISTFQTERI